MRSSLNVRRFHHASSNSQKNFKFSSDHTCTATQTSQHTNTSNLEPVQFSTGFMIPVQTKNKLSSFSIQSTKSISSLSQKFSYSIQSQQEPLKELEYLLLALKQKIYVNGGSRILVRPLFQYMQLTYCIRRYFIMYLVSAQCSSPPQLLIAPSVFTSLPS